jgi:hypothetical protein
MKTNSIIQTLKETISILGTFITLKAIATIYSFAVNAPWYLSQVRLAELIVLAVVSYYAIKGRIFALWAMGIYLVIHVFALFLAILVIPIDQYVVKIITIILSLYFVFGGIVLIQSARAKTAQK